MSEKNPIASVIAICFNHEKYLIECLQSVVNQTYKNVELIIVDDFSTDNSREEILEFIKENPNCQVIFNENNIGNCRSFNKAFKISKGRYIIDLSTDDVLMPNRIEEQVYLMESVSNVGVVFSDANFINEKSEYIGNFRKNLKLPIGNVYEDVLAGKCFTMPVTGMMRRTILEQLNGYDETLAYEDFDFWVRSSRICEFGYVPKILSYQRILSGSHSTNFFIKHSSLVQSSVKVCQKAYQLNETESENKSLAIRLRFELLRCAFTENFDSAKNVIELLDKTNGHNWKTLVARLFVYFRIPINSIFVRVMNLRRLMRYGVKVF
jgi:glycosyltransferase involved in cell wall biosynthesis